LKKPGREPGFFMRMFYLCMSRKTLVSKVKDALIFLGRPHE